jgi:hypothetical protein
MSFTGGSFSQSIRIDGLAARTSTLETRATTIETAATTQRTNFTSFTGTTNTKDIEQNARLSAIEAGVTGFRNTYNTYTAANDVKNTEQNARLDAIESGVTGFRNAYNTYTAANDVKNSTQNARSDAIDAGLTGANLRQTAHRTAFETFKTDNNADNTAQDTRMTAIETLASQRNTAWTDKIQARTDFDTQLNIDILRVDGKCNTTNANLESHKTTYSAFVVANNAIEIAQDTQMASIEAGLTGFRQTYNTYTAANNVKNSEQDDRLTDYDAGLFASVMLQEYQQDAYDSYVAGNTGKMVLQDGRLDALDLGVTGLYTTYNSFVGSNDGEVGDYKAAYELYVAGNTGTNVGQDARLDDLEEGVTGARQNFNAFVATNNAKNTAQNTTITQNHNLYLAWVEGNGATGATGTTLIYLQDQDITQTEGRLDAIQTDISNLVQAAIDSKVPESTYQELAQELRDADTNLSSILDTKVLASVQATFDAAQDTRIAARVAQTAYDTYTDASDQSAKIKELKIAAMEQFIRTFLTTYPIVNGAGQTYVYRGYAQPDFDVLPPAVSVIGRFSGNRKLSCRIAEFATRSRSNKVKVTDVLGATLLDTTITRASLIIGSARGDRVSELTLSRALVEADFPITVKYSDTLGNTISSQTLTYINYQTTIVEDNLSPTVWYQIGSDIDGEFLDDQSGSSVSLSADGLTIAITARNNDADVPNSNRGHCRVYGWDGSAWVQKGLDIDGEANNDTSGNLPTSVSLSADGSAVAIGASRNDGNGTDSGHCRVYVFNSETGLWVQRGQDIDGEAASDASGTSVSLSADGLTVAIGADNNDGTGSNAGHCRVYAFNTVTSLWVKRGQDIDGELADDRSGICVSLSADGLTVAIGANLNDGPTANSNVGHCRVWAWNNSTSLWVRKGQDLDGEAGNDQSGGAVSLSADGNVVAIGAWSNNGGGNDSGHVRVYGWNSATSLWVQRGADIDGKTINNSFGIALALSSNGLVLVVGADVNDDAGIDAGQVRVFTWDSPNNDNTGTWVQKGVDINGVAAGERVGQSVCVNADGSIIAVPSRFRAGLNGATSGHVRVFKFASLDSSSVPEAPVITSVTVEDGNVIVEFSTPYDGGSAITGYKVTSSGGQIVTGTSSPITLSGLVNGTSYTFTVVATNAKGDSPASVVSEPVTLGSAASVPTVGGSNILYSASVSPPFDVVNITSQIGLIIDDGGSPITNITATGPNGQSITVNGNTSQLNFDFLMPNDSMEYSGQGEAYIEIVATNAVGASIPLNVLIYYSF